MLAGLSLFVLVAVTGVAASGGSAAPLGKEPAQLPKHLDKRVCGDGGDSAACMAKVVTKPDGGSPLATTSYLYGYGPADLADAYKWPFAPSADWVGNGQTVAIVDAYDNPNAEADLSAYRAQFGLPACTSANGCFRKVNQRGGSTPPTANVGWGQEIDLDIEMVSAVCPECKILLVEANSNSFTDLGAAVNQAAALGANAISNSYGTSSEFRRRRPTSLLQPPGHRGHRQHRRQRLRHTYPASRRTSSPSAARRSTRTPPRAAGRSRPGAGRAAAAARSSPSPGGSTTRAAASGPWPTSRRWPIRTPASRSTTATARAAETTGTSSAARASRRRSSPRRTRWQETPGASTTRRSFPTHDPARSSTSPAATTEAASKGKRPAAQRRPISAPQGRATTGRPGSARPTEPTLSKLQHLSSSSPSFRAPPR